MESTVGVRRDTREKNKCQGNHRFLMNSNTPSSMNVPMSSSLLNNPIIGNTENYKKRKIYGLLFWCTSGLVQWK